jgi:hypothetical protein
MLHGAQQSAHPAGHGRHGCAVLDACRHASVVASDRAGRRVQKRDARVEPADTRPACAAIKDGERAVRRCRADDLAVDDPPDDDWLKKAMGHPPRQKGALGLGRVKATTRE